MAASHVSRASMCYIHTRAANRNAKDAHRERTSLPRSETRSNWTGVAQREDLIWGGFRSWDLRGFLVAVSAVSASLCPQRAVLLVLQLQMWRMNNRENAEGEAELDATDALHLQREGKVRTDFSSTYFMHYVELPFINSLLTCISSYFTSQMTELKTFCSACVGFFLQV